jgi:hypothetical protein
MGITQDRNTLPATHSALLEIEELRRHRPSCSKSLDPSKLRRNRNGSLFKVAKEYQHRDSVAGSIDHSNDIRKRILAKDHGPRREFHKPRVSRFAGYDRN